MEYVFSPDEASEFHDAFQHIHFFPLLNFADSEQFIKHLQKKYGWQTNNIDVKKICIQTGGHTWLIKEIVREQSQGKKIKDITISTQYLYKCKTIFNRIPEDLKETLSSIASKNFIKDNNSKLVALMQLGFVKDQKEHIVPEFIQEQLKSRSSSLEVIGERLIHNKIDITAYFSTQEIIFLKQILSSKDFQARESVAKLIWPNGSYSDWTFDQLVKRIRKKFSKIGLSPKLIVTKRGRGVTYDY